jgi:hypothetical protein
LYTYQKPKTIGSHDIAQELELLFDTMDQVDGGIIFIAFCRHQKDRKASELFGIASLGFTVNFVKVDLEIDSLSHLGIVLFLSICFHECYKHYHVHGCDNP